MEMKELVKKLNVYADAYYNEGQSLISDREYDELFDELLKMEKEAGFAYPDSPTQRVGSSLKTSLNKVAHNHPMLSLDKTKDIIEIYKFVDNKPALVMAKMDGLTCSIRYVDGKLVSAETRGDGAVGEDVTLNALYAQNIPTDINATGEVVVDGEVIVTEEVLRNVNSVLTPEEQFTCPRNYAAGGIRLQDPEESKAKQLSFVAWKLVKGGENEKSFVEQLSFLVDMGFTVVPHFSIAVTDTVNDYLSYVDQIRNQCKAMGYPLDGCVFSFDSVALIKSMGATNHHLRGQMAYKFYDDTYETILRDIEWTVGKTGQITPTAIFDPVMIDGTIVGRASLHNIGVMSSLLGQPFEGQKIKVYKANMIIPQVDSAVTLYNGTNGKVLLPPVQCPACGHNLTIVQGTTMMLICPNPMCEAQGLQKLVSFVARDAANIDGLSEQTLSRLVYAGYVTDAVSIYHLGEYADKLKAMPGFGEQSVANMLSAIENSRNIAPVNFIKSLQIPNFGTGAAKLIMQKYGNFADALAAMRSGDIATVSGVGQNTAMEVLQWMVDNCDFVDALLNEVNIIETVQTVSDNTLAGMRFCVTGTFAESRETIIKKLEAKGAVFVSGVSKKLDILFVGDSAGSKLDKAKSLGIKIGTPEDLAKIL